MWTASGLVDVYLLVFLHLGSRRVWISPSTVQPDSAWDTLQARNFLMVADDMGPAPEYVMRDNDAKFSGEFYDVFKTSGVEIKRKDHGERKDHGDTPVFHLDAGKSSEVARKRCSKSVEMRLCGGTIDETGPQRRVLGCGRREVRSMKRCAVIDVRSAARLTAPEAGPNQT